MRDAVRCAACSVLLVMLSTGLPVPPLSAATTPVGINAVISPAAAHPMMLWGDTSRLGRPFSKDPSVIRFRGRYLLYYSMPSYGDQRPNDGWGIGIAESRNLYDWTKVGEFLAAEPAEGLGVAAPLALVVDGRVHLFYQGYGRGPADAICHAVSADGLHFERDATNPIFRPSGTWTVGRAIDAEVVRLGRRWLLYAATRDPQMKVQMLAGAVSEGGFERGAWRMLADRPILKPDLPWEQDCIEAPTVLRRGETLFMFYAGAYNNAPQQIGLARSTDGVTWTRVSDRPFLANGAPGAWNSSESGHPGVFVDEDGTPYLFYQGNDDHGRTWRISFVRLGWRDGLPVIVGPETMTDTGSRPSFDGRQPASARGSAWVNAGDVSGVASNMWRDCEGPAMNTHRKTLMLILGVVAVVTSHVHSAAPGDAGQATAPGRAAQGPAPGGVAPATAPASAPRTIAPYFTPAASLPKAPDADGFLQRWLLLEPITKPNRTQHRVHRQLHPERLRHRVLPRPVHRGSARRRQGDGGRPGTGMACPGFLRFQRQALSLRLRPEQADLRRHLLGRHGGRQLRGR